MKVIMLDDSPTFLLAAQQLLAQHEITVITIGSWVELAQALAAHDPDVLIIDLNMPGLQGDQVGDIVRRLSRCPILFLSGESEDRLRSACAGIPNSTFLQKNMLECTLPLKLQTIALRVPK